MSPEKEASPLQSPRAPSLSDILSHLEATAPSALLAQWKEIEKNYTEDIRICISRQSVSSTQFDQKLEDIQQSFIEVIEEKDDKFKTIINFQSKYNKFVDEQKDLLHDKQTKSEITAYLEEIYERIWQSLDQKKDTALRLKQQIIESNWTEKEQEVLTQIFQKILQTEINYMTELCYLGENTLHSAQGRPLNFDLEHSIIDPFSIKKPLPPISMPDDWNSYPRMQQVFQHTRQLLDG